MVLQLLLLINGPIGVSKKSLNRFQFKTQNVLIYYHQKQKLAANSYN